MKHFNLHPTFYVLFSLFFLFSCSKKEPKAVGKKALLKEKISIGDSLFKAGNYITASEYYKKALIIQPNNQYVTKKLKEIDAKTGVSVAVKNDTPKAKVTEKKPKENIKATKKVATATKPTKKAKPVVQKKRTTKVTYNNANKNTNFFKNPYHIIIGSFKIKNNAIFLANKFKNKGYNAVQISRFNGEFTAVSILSLNNIHTAYNNMYDIRDKFGIDDAWVLYQKNNTVATTKSTKALPTKKYGNNKIYSNGKYNVVIGSFKIKNNADLLTDNYKNKGYKAKQIPRFNGKFTAVAIAFANSYQAARKSMNKIKNDLGVDAWILKQ